MMNRVQTLIVGALCILLSTTSFAGSHGRKQTTCLLADMIVAQAQSSGVTIAIPQTLAFCGKYMSMENSAENYHKMHKDPYVSDRLNAIADLSSAYALLARSGSLGSLPDPQFLLAEEGARHEWMQPLVQLASYLVTLQKQLPNDYYLNAYMASIQAKLPAVQAHLRHMEHMGMSDGLLTDKGHGKHYTNVHPLGDDVGNVLIRLREMRAQGMVDASLYDAIHLKAIALEPALSLMIPQNKNDAISLWLILLPLAVLAVLAAGYRSRKVISA